MHLSKELFQYKIFTSITKKGVLFSLVVCCTLIFLAGCGSTSTGSPSTPSSTPTATSGGYSSDNGSTGKYGSGSGTGGSNATPTTAVSGPSQTVLIMTGGSGFGFNPTALTIPVGTTVVWKNSTRASHTVTSDDGSSFNSGNSTPVQPGSTFSFKFTKAGTFHYHCNFHPSMTATIIVK